MEGLEETDHNGQPESNKDERREYQRAERHAASVVVCAPACQSTPETEEERQFLDRHELSDEQREQLVDRLLERR